VEQLLTSMLGEVGPATALVAALALLWFRVKTLEEWRVTVDERMWDMHGEEGE
jgi:hypothetical protein